MGSISPQKERLNFSNKRYQLSPATCSQTLNCSEEGSSAFLSGYFHFSSFQPCLGARLLGRRRAAVDGSWARRCPDLGRPWGISCASVSPEQEGVTPSSSSPNLSSSIEAHRSLLQTPVASAATASQLPSAVGEKIWKPEVSQTPRDVFSEQAALCAPTTEPSHGFLGSRAAWQGQGHSHSHAALEGRGGWRRAQFLSPSQ